MDRNGSDRGRQLKMSGNDESTGTRMGGGGGNPSQNRPPKGPKLPKPTPVKPPPKAGKAKPSKGA